MFFVKESDFVGQKFLYWCVVRMEVNKKDFAQNKTQKERDRIEET